jgi:hypothetical protein
MTWDEIAPGIRKMFTEAFPATYAMNLTMGLDKGEYRIIA